MVLLLLQPTGYKRKIKFQLIRHDFYLKSSPDTKINKQNVLEGDLQFNIGVSGRATYFNV